MTFTTIQYGSVEKTLADWGVSQSAIPQTETNLRAGTLRLTIPQASVASNPVFPYLAKIILRAGRTRTDDGSFSEGSGTVEFVGYRMLEVVQNSAGFGGVHYDFQNAWFFLAETRFQQRRAVIPTSYPDLLYKYTTDVILGMKLGPSNTRVELNIGAQIREAFQFVLDNPPAADAVPFLIGTIDSDAPLPFFATTEISCQEVIQKCLDLAPDCTVFCDYSTTVASQAVPTFHVRARANLTPVTRRAVCSAAGREMQELNIQRLDNLVPAAMLIYYNVLSSIQGVSFIDPQLDKFGPHGANSGSDPSAGFGIVLQTFDLIGPSINSQSAELAVEVCNANHAVQNTRRDWWKKYTVKLQDTDVCRVKANSFNIANATITAHGDQPGFADGAAVSLATYPNVLLDTAIFDWMRVSNTPVAGVRCKISALLTITYEKRHGATGPWKTEGVETITIQTERTLTNGITAVYSTSGGSAGDTPPVGLARKVYLSLGGALLAGADAAYPGGRAAVYQYQGAHVAVDATPPNDVTMANTLNLSNGRAEWAAMNAQVQSITKDHATGRTTVSIGPATHINAGNLIALQMWNRTRIRTTITSVRETGLA